MRSLSPWLDAGPVELLLVGAHADDIEIGCGGTVLRWAREGRIARVTWLVLSGADERAGEAQRSASAFLAEVPDVSVRVESFRDGFFPYQGESLKELFEVIKTRCAPAIVLTHGLDDLHQDHRLIGELTWQTFRDHLILEYEVPKFDGGLGRPNAYVEVPDWAVHEKGRLLLAHFPSQHERHWFTADTFSSLARLRGVECRSATGFAEAFECRKLAIA